MQPRSFALTDPAAIRALVAANPWAIVVSSPPAGIIASHTPMLLEEPAAAADGDGDIVLVTHLGLGDGRRHGLVDGGEVLVIVQGGHGYVSPSWYAEADATTAPTWNFDVAHLTCSVEVLDADANLAVLQRLVAHFEEGPGYGGGPAIEHPVRLDVGDPRTRALASGTMGLRLTMTSVEAKAKHSQNKTRETREQVAAALDERDPALARRVRDELASSDRRASES